MNLRLANNNDLDFLRYKITKIGYYISREELVKDIKSDYGESHLETYAKAGKDFIDRLIANDKKKTKSDYFVKK